MTIHTFIGSPKELPTDSIPSKRDVMRFINLRRIQLQKTKRLPSNSEVFSDVAQTLTDYYIPRKDLQLHQTAALNGMC